jgi:hypothetical protein
LKYNRDETAHRLNELDDANRILRTKCAQLEAGKNKVFNEEVDKGQFAAPPGPISKQDKSSYDDLFKAYDILQREHRITIAKKKEQIGKLKKEIQILKLRSRAPRVKNYHPSFSIVNDGENVEVAKVEDVCLYVFGTTLTSLEHMSDTNDDARPVSARRTFFFIFFILGHYHTHRADAMQ